MEKIIKTKRTTVIITDRDLDGCSHKSIPGKDFKIYIDSTKYDIKYDIIHLVGNIIADRNVREILEMDDLVNKDVLGLMDKAYEESYQEVLEFLDKFCD